MQKKKIIELIIGSNNQGKLKEIKDLLPKKLKIYTPKIFNLKSPRETGKSFRENSIIKAKFYSKKTGLICLADDSGLEIDILNKSPGIYSSRWAGKKNNFNLAIKKIYSKLNKKDKDWKTKRIKCRFICSLSIYWPNNIIKNVSGVIEGKISKSKKGKNGFGYDPIFIPLGGSKTFGQMKPRNKFKIDHRSKAFKKIRKFF
jgi:XTP/dITP diphosphohydrolase|tara:strand:+ start:201 stop:803 length:603 start_codon:yes stop_codon:yes gene_type:complete